MAIQSNFPNIQPSLNLSFAQTKTLDPRITFARASEARFYDGKTFAKAEENLLLNSATLSTQNVTTRAEPYTLSFIGTGTVTLSGTSTAGPLVGTGATNRVTLTFTPTAGTLTLTVTGTVEQAQLEARSSATAWTATTTQPITNYIPVLQTAAANVARFDHSPTTGESLGLLIEEQRTNLLTYSEQFDNAAWTPNAATIQPNTIVAPDGALTGDLLVATGTASSRIRCTTAQAINTTYTASIYAKQGTGRYLRFRNLAIDASGWIDLQTGATSATVGTTATAALVGNGWYRLALTATTPASIASNLIDIQVVDALNSTASVIDSGIYIWGAQLEAGAFPTSYIPTAASQVTRNADAASMTGVNFTGWYRQDEGTLYAEAAFLAAVTLQQIFNVSDGTVANLIGIRASPSMATSSRFTVTAGGVSQADINVINGANAGVFTKHAGAYKVDDFAVSVNGQNALTDTSGVLISATQARIGATPVGVTANVYVRKLAYYPSRLPNAQLQALTS
jgi:hypothetical protein